MKMPKLPEFSRELWKQLSEDGEEMVKAYARAYGEMVREAAAKECLEVSKAITSEGEGCRDGRYDFAASGAADCARYIRKDYE